MWMFTKYGFFSVVCGRDYEATPGAKSKNAPIDPDVIMLRARSAEHLNALLDATCDLWPADDCPEIIESDGNDYRFRIIVSREDWEQRIGPVLCAAVTYGNFKAEAAATLNDAEYNTWLHETWGGGWRLQQGYSKQTYWKIHGILAKEKNLKALRDKAADLLELGANSNAVADAVADLEHKDWQKSLMK
jgi:hypothetical protein